MPHKVEAWKCDYCNKVTISTGSTSAHEAHCKKNPNNRYCATCAKCYCEHVVEDADMHSDPYEHDVLWCKQYDKPIYEKPYFEECKVDEDYGTIRNIPCTCFEYEQKE